MYTIMLSAFVNNSSMGNTTNLGEIYFTQMRKAATRSVSHQDQTPCILLALLQMVA